MISMKIDEVNVQGAPLCNCGSRYWTYIADDDQLICSNCGDPWYGNTDESKQILDKCRQITAPFGVDLD